MPKVQPKGHIRIVVPLIKPTGFCIKKNPFCKVWFCFVFGMTKSVFSNFDLKISVL